MCFVLNSESRNVTFFPHAASLCQFEKMIDVGPRSSPFAAAQKTDLREAAFEIHTSTWRTGIRLSFFIYLLRRMMQEGWNGWVKRSGTPPRRQTAPATDLWSWLWSRESRSPLRWRRGRCTVPQPARSLHAGTGLHPGKHNVTDKPRRGRTRTDSAVRQLRDENRMKF